jgi:tetratricopeptide (TPR) repeat protein
MVGKANTLYEIGQHEEAIQYYMKALKINNEIPDVFYNLANALFMTKDIDKAIVYYK